MLLLFLANLAGSQLHIEVTGVFFSHQVPTVFSEISPLFLYSHCAYKAFFILFIVKDHLRIAASRLNNYSF